MLEDIKLERVLFLDIETAPLVYHYKDLPEATRLLWDAKFRYQQEGPEGHYVKSGIYAEFAKVICISVGFFNAGKFRIKSYYGHDEKVVLKGFAELLNKHYNRKDHMLCAHNGKEFDFPFMARRMLINRIKLPKLLNIAGKKPWEVNHLDTMELWKFGDFKNFTSLSLLAQVFGIPTPKDEMDGSDVPRVYWEEKDLERIRIYCQKDVLTVAQLIRCYKGEALVKNEEVIVA